MLAVDIKNVARVYGTGAQAVYALRDINLAVEAGQFVALKGRSGSGKTTLLNCVGGLDKPTSGEVLVSGHDVVQMSDRELTQWRQREVGFIFQAYGLIPSLSAYENVELMLRIAGKKNRKKRAMEALEIVGLGDKGRNRPYELSGGQVQRVAIARAMVTNPRLILADEATGELDTQTSHDILALFKGVADEGVTILLATHDDLVDSYVDKVVYLSQGMVFDAEAAAS